MVRVCVNGSLQVNTKSVTGHGQPTPLRLTGPGNTDGRASPGASSGRTEGQ